tara:strand:- start:41708 stop:42262 length:555 start_codon:yes stop_codon:yes gene_type:complete
MTDSLNQIQQKPFYKLLLGRTVLPIVTILGIGILYVFLMSMIDHPSFPFHIIIVTAALGKTIIITMTTLKRLSKLIKICHSLERLLWVFGLIIIISIFSFATDYTCLFQFSHTTFEGVPNYSTSYLYNLYHFFYFSVITFSTVGYGEIIPTSDVARFVVMLEIFLSFFLVVFAFANIKKIHINE